MLIARAWSHYVKTAVSAATRYLWLKELMGINFLFLESKILYNHSSYALFLIYFCLYRLLANQFLGDTMISSHNIYTPDKLVLHIPQCWCLSLPPTSLVKSSIRKKDSAVFFIRYWSSSTGYSLELSGIAHVCFNNIINIISEAYHYHSIGSCKIFIHTQYLILILLVFASLWYICLFY